MHEYHNHLNLLNGKDINYITLLGILILYRDEPAHHRRQRNPGRKDKRTLNVSNIFFLETQKRAEMFSLYQLCAIESAAYHHPGHNIVVVMLFSKEVKF